MLTPCLFFIFTTCFTIALQAQQGYLFIMGSDTAFHHSLWQVAIPEGTATLLFTDGVIDMAHTGDTLFVLEEPGVLHLYDVSQQQVVDSLLAPAAKHLAVSTDQLALLSDLSPHLRVVDRYTGQLLFVSGASNKLADATDLAFSGDTLWVARPDTLQRYLTGAGYALMEARTPDPFGFVNASANSFVWIHKEKAYVQRDYTTGAPRQAWLSYEVKTLQLDTCFYDILFFSQAPPVPADEVIYLNTYEDRYLIGQQQLILGSASTSLYPMAWDQKSSHLFVIGAADGGIYMAVPGDNWTLLSTLPYRGDFLSRQGLFMHEIINGTNRKSHSRLSLFPNPASDQVSLLLPPGEWELQVVNADGQGVYQEAQQIGRVVLAVSAWPVGLYVIQALSSAGQFQQVKLIKQ